MNSFFRLPPASLKRWIVLGCAVLLAGGGVAVFWPGRAGESSGEEDKKPELVLMIELAAAPLVREKVLPLIRARFPGLTITSKLRDDAQVEHAVKSSFAAGEAIDMVAFWPHQMRTFVDNGMALDLSPHLEADPRWRDSWIPGTLEDGQFYGKTYALPYRISYPLLLVNRDLARRAGIVLPGERGASPQWTWEEFLAACEGIKARAQTLSGGGSPVYPLGINSIWACWFVRNALMQIWDSAGELEAFTQGKIPFTDPRVLQVFENVKTLYDRDYLYPGAAALTVTHDQALSAFARGEIAILANVNGNASTTKTGVVAGAFEIAVMSWPNMGAASQDRLLGSSDGYFIPSNSRLPDQGVEILKYLCGPEILRLYADEGRILPFKNIVSSNPDYPLYSRDIRKVHSTEIVNFSPELNDYIIYNIPAYYILYGRRSIEELEILRGTVRP
jgi:ABC-type glycerol-3-phosphate transport system substrate-binding protein